MRYFEVREPFKKLTELQLRVGRNIFWKFCAECVSKLFISLWSIYLARKLGPKYFGILMYGQTLAQYLWICSDFGIGNYGTVMIARDKENISRTKSDLLTIRVFFAITVYMGLFCILLLRNGETFTTKIYLILGVFIIANSFNIDWLFRGIERIQFVAIGTAITSGLYLLCVVLSVNGPEHTITAAIFWPLAFFVGAVFLNWKAVRLGYSRIFSLPSKKWVIYIKEAKFFYLSVIFMMGLQYLPVFMIGAILSPYDVGMFYAPFKLYTSLSTLAFVIIAGFFPTLADLSCGKTHLFNRSASYLIKLLLIIGFVCSFIIVAFSKPCIVLLFGEKYLDSITVFRLFGILFPLFLLRQGYLQPLLAAKKAGYVSLVSSLGIGILVVSIIFLVKKFGINGAVYSMILSECSILLFHIFFRMRWRDL